MTNPLGSFIWYELMTSDAAGAAVFYGAVVGWNIVGEAPAEPQAIDYRHIVRNDGGKTGGVLQLSAQMIDGGARPGWVGYLYVADPQGVPLYVMSPIAPEGREGQKSDANDRWKPGHVSWNELYTSDVEAAKSFYAKYFDFQFKDSMPMGDMGDYWFIDHGGEQIG